MSELDDILSEIDITDWLDWEGISYRRAGSGSNLNLKDCVFCGDSRHKVYMRADNGLGTCFHGDCNEKFNLFSFARRHLNADARSTIAHFKDYALRTGIGPRATPVVRHEPNTEGWQMPPSIALPTLEGMTHQFLIDRGITIKTQIAFDLRFCAEGRFDYQDIDGQFRQMIYDQRIIIPVHDLDGVVKTFQGRDVSGTSDRRYLFPATLPGTGRFLYGGHLIAEKPHLVFGEGPFDVMAIHQALIDHPDFRAVGAIGSFGLSIGHSDHIGNDDQLHRLLLLKAQGLAQITFLWDGTRAAWLAALEAGIMLRRHGFKVRMGALPQDKDPNEVDTATVRRAITDAQLLNDQSYTTLRLLIPFK